MNNSDKKGYMHYYALALQTKCKSVNNVNNRDDAQAIMFESIDRVDDQIKGSLAFIGAETKLVVLPEYFLTGFPMGDTFEEWKKKACIDIDGPEYEKLGKVAQRHNVYLAGNAYENDEHFPELYFQTSFIISPNGDVILRYRRLNSMYAPTPHDVWDKYLDIYGIEQVFPVAKTEIGNLAAIASEEILFPEVARCLTMRGAEVFVHSSSEVSSPTQTRKHIARLARSVENTAYVVSANTAGIDSFPIPVASADGSSAIVDYNGNVLAQADVGESMVANAEIDIAALRRNRSRPNMNNLLCRQRFELYADSYKHHSFYPANTLLNKEAKREHFRLMNEEIVNKLKGMGIIR